MVKASGAGWSSPPGAVVSEDSGVEFFVEQYALMTALQSSASPILHASVRSLPQYTGCALFEASRLSRRSWQNLPRSNMILFWRIIELKLLQ